MKIRKTALITGGSRGIGKGIVQYFAKKQIDVAFTYRKAEDEAMQLCTETEIACGTKCIAIQADVTDAASVTMTFDKFQEEFGKLDILVNNAGVIRDQSILVMDWDEWHAVIDTNLNGAYHMCKKAAAMMLRQKFGAIVNITSTAGLMGVPGQTNYSASKAGLIGFTRSLARECAPRNVRVNAVAPGFIETDMSSSLHTNQRKQILSSIPLKRYGQVEDVTAMVHFLAGEEAQYITGQVFVIDGGLTIV